MSYPTINETFIDESRIGAMLREQGQPDRARIAEILAKARTLVGLDPEEVAVLLRADDPETAREVRATAHSIKEQIYGSRIVLFAPLYLSNYCSNDCEYCSFRSRNFEIARRALSQADLAREVKCLVEQGHKRVLLVSGEAYREGGLDYVLEAIETIYDTRSGRGEIRRVNVNIAPLDAAGFARLKAANIGTFQLFQETYHRATYAEVHTRGVKRDYDWRVTAMDRAMATGIDDVGIGALFGLYDWKFEVLALLEHARHLERRFGVGPHTISVPRLEPAEGAPMSFNPPYAVSDEDFLRLIAILRLAVPYTGIILSTREAAETRRECLALGVSQISAGSRTNPGGYSESVEAAGAQFQLGDHRPLDEVIRDLAELGYIPSFCTACYRLGRTGGDFMDLARPGEIKYHCEPNAYSSFAEYLEDYGSEETRAAGRAFISRTLPVLDARQRRICNRLMDQVAAGRRDVFV